MGFPCLLLACSERHGGLVGWSLRLRAEDPASSMGPNASHHKARESGGLGRSSLEGRARRKSGSPERGEGEQWVGRRQATHAGRAWTDSGQERTDGSGKEAGCWQLSAARRGGWERKRAAHHRATSTGGLTVPSWERPLTPERGAGPGRGGVGTLTSPPRRHTQNQLLGAFHSAHGAAAGLI